MNDYITNDYFRQTIRSSAWRLAYHAARVALCVAAVKVEGRQACVEHPAVVVGIALWVLNDVYHAVNEALSIRAMRQIVAVARSNRARGKMCLCLGPCDCAERRTAADVARRYGDPATCEGCGLQSCVCKEGF